MRKREKARLLEHIRNARAGMTHLYTLLRDLSTEAAPDRVLHPSRFLMLTGLAAEAQQPMSYLNQAIEMLEPEVEGDTDAE